MQRGEHEVPGERRLDGDASGLAVADLTHHDHVGIRAHHRAQARREGETRARGDLNLREAGDFVLDRVLDRDDVLLGRVERLQGRVKGCRLA